jgi:hypothetical protein
MAAFVLLVFAMARSNHGNQLPCPISDLASVRRLPISIAWRKYDMRG